MVQFMVIGFVVRQLVRRFKSCAMPCRPCRAAIWCTGCKKPPVTSWVELQAALILMRRRFADILREIENAGAGDASIGVFR